MSQGGRLAPVLDLLDTAAWADRLVRQNLVLTLAYDTHAVPPAVTGLVTTLLFASG